MSIFLRDKTQLLSGKKILFFSQFFFGYENKIANKYREYGALVDLFDEMSVRSYFERALLKISPYLFKFKTEKYYKYILNNILNKKYDYVLFVDCEMPTEKILKEYKSVFKNTKFCLHLWDSLHNLPGVVEKFKYFDFISSFDKNDCDNNNPIKFRPLFFCDEYKNHKCSNNSIYDLCFIGTIHSDRYRIIKNIEEQCKKLKLKLYNYSYLQSKFIYYYYKIFNKNFNKADFNSFSFIKKSQKDISEIENNSIAILDIEHPSQTGLTMRTIECVGLGKKLITTNKFIKDYDFYDKSRIYIIDREKPVIEKEFFEFPYKTLDEKVYSKYSLDQWIFDVLGIS